MRARSTSPVRTAKVSAGFDADAKKILNAYLDAGWTATSSTNGHVVLRAPDGVTTTAMGCRANGRTAKNAIAPLNRWLRSQKASEKPQPKPKPIAKPKPVVRQPRKEAMTTVTPSQMPGAKPQPKPDDLRSRVDAAVAKITELGTAVPDLLDLIGELRARNEELEAKFALMSEALSA